MLVRAKALNKGLFLSFTVVWTATGGSTTRYAAGFIGAYRCHIATSDFDTAHPTYARVQLQGGHRVPNNNFRHFLPFWNRVPPAMEGKPPNLSGSWNVAKVLAQLLSPFSARFHSLSRRTLCHWRVGTCSGQHTAVHGMKQPDCSFAAITGGAPHVAEITQSGFVP